MLDQLNDVFCRMVAQRAVVASCGVSPREGRPLEPQLGVVSNTTGYSEVWVGVSTGSRSVLWKHLQPTKTQLQAVVTSTSCHVFPKLKFPR